MRVEKGREVPEALLEAPQSRGQSGRVEVHLQIECQLLRGPAGKDSLGKRGAAICRCRATYLEDILMFL